MRAEVNGCRENCPHLYLAGEATLMKVYVKNRNESHWHWVFECPKYPEGSKVDKTYKYPGEKLLCPFCKQIEAGGKRKSKIKEIVDDENLH